MLTELRHVINEKALELGFIVHILNGYLDHIHILISIPPKYSLSEIFKIIKGYSSFKIKELRWQNGFAAFTVDKNSFSTIFDYIKNQEDHHKKIDLK